MIEIYRGRTTTVVERRASGITLAQELDRRFPPPKVGIPLFKKPDEAQRLQIPTPDLFFASFEDVQISFDCQHVIAIGRDEDRLTLIMDEKVPLNGAYNQLKVMQKSEDLNEAIVASQDNQGQWALHFVDEKGQVKPLLAEMDAISFEGWWKGNFLRDQNIYMASYRNKVPTEATATGSAMGEFIEVNSTVTVAYDSFGNLLNSIEVAQEIDLGDIRLLHTTDDCQQIIWSVVTEKTDSHPETKRFYRNSALLVDNVKFIRFSQDLSQFIAVRVNADGASEICQNGQVIWTTRMDVATILSNDDLSFAVAILRDENHYQLFYATPDGYQLTEPFDHLYPDVRVNGNGIEAEFNRDVVARKLEVTRGQNGLEVTESAV